MSKNIVICCDGTANEFAKNNTNVVKLYYALEGSSVIKCCYTAISRSLILLNSTVTSMKTITKRILSGTATNTSLKLSRLETNPACIAGVLISRPNFSALWGLMKL